MKQKTKITLYIVAGAIGLLSLSATYVNALTLTHFEVEEILNGKRGINYQADKKQELTIKEHICIASNGEYCELLVNLAKCESSLNKDAINVNRNGTVDLGLYQWNSVHFNGKITPVCALDVYCATRKTVAEIKAGHLNWWVCSDKI